MQEKNKVIRQTNHWTMTLMIGVLATGFCAETYALDPGINQPGAYGGRAGVPAAGAAGRPGSGIGVMPGAGAGRAGVPAAGAAGRPGSGVGALPGTGAGRAGVPAAGRPGRYR
ncbi:MAG: hypothetical protein ACOYMG_24085 [Candidatus Methylumidiphilus sp.]